MAEAAASPGRSECAAADEPNSPLSGQRSHAAQQSEALGSRVESLHSRIDALLERARSPVEDGDERAHGDGDLEEEEEEEEDQEVKRSRDGRDGSLEAALHALPRSPAAQRRERDLKQLREPDSDAEALLAELGVAKAPAGIGSNRTRPLRARPAALDAAAAPRVSERALGAAKHPHFMRGEHIADAVAMQRIRSVRQCGVADYAFEDRQTFPLDELAELVHHAARSEGRDPPLDLLDDSEAAALENRAALAEIAVARGEALQAELAERAAVNVAELERAKCDEMQASLQGRAVAEAQLRSQIQAMRGTLRAAQSRADTALKEQQQALQRSAAIEQRWATDVGAILQQQQQVVALFQQAHVRLEESERARIAAESELRALREALALERSAAAEHAQRLKATAEIATQSEMCSATVSAPVSTQAAEEERPPSRLGCDSKTPAAAGDGSSSTASPRGSVHGDGDMASVPQAADASYSNANSANGVVGNEDSARGPQPVGERRPPQQSGAQHQGSPQQTSFETRETQTSQPLLEAQERPKPNSPSSSNLKTRKTAEAKDEVLAQLVNALHERLDARAVERLAVARRADQSTAKCRSAAAASPHRGERRPQSDPYKGLWNRLPSTRADDDDHLEQLKDKSRRILQEENGLLRRQMSTLMEHVDSLQRDQRLLLDEVQRARGESHSLRLRLEQADGDCRRATVRLRHALEELARMRAEQSEMVDQQQQCRSYAELQTKRRASRRAQ